MNRLAAEQVMPLRTGIGIEIPARMSWGEGLIQTAGRIGGSAQRTFYHPVSICHHFKREILKVDGIGDLRGLKLGVTAISDETYQRCGLLW